MDTIGIVGACEGIEAVASARPASTGSMRGEWKACDPGSRLVRTPRSASCPAIRSTTSCTPATTTADGPFTAARDTSSSCPSSSGSTSDSPAATASIAPPGGRACIDRARIVTRAQASRRDRTPATWAAVISPSECPATTSGRTPQDSTSRYSATPTANSAGWAHPVRSSSSASSPHITSSSGLSSHRSSSGTTSSSALANTGNRSCRSRPIPSRWEPWPVNTTPTRPRPATPSTTASPTMATRCSKCDRVDASDHPTSTRSSPGRSPAQDRSRSAWSRAAAADRPDSTHGTGWRHPSPASGSGVSGACSRITWAFVPLMPNDDTADRRGRSASGQAFCSVSSSTAPVDQSTWDDRSVTCSVLGTIPRRIAITILMTPATPAAACA